jgi:hypothetical protein
LIVELLKRKKERRKREGVVIIYSEGASPIAKLM